MDYGMIKRNRHRTQGSSGNKNQWMLTFGDLLSLILTFFVMLYAMSVMHQEERWKRITHSLSQRLNPAAPTEESKPAEQYSIDRVEVPIAKDLDYLNTILTEKASDALKGSTIKLQRTDTELVISLSSDEAFTKGSASLNPDALGTLAIIGDMIGSIGNAIDVVGYSDPTPTSSALYPSNWELSLARAVTVAHFIKGRGYMYGVTSYGRGASTYELLSPDLAKKEKYDFLRRVDIVIRAELARP